MLETRHRSRQVLVFMTTQSKKIKRESKRWEEAKTCTHMLAKGGRNGVEGRGRGTYIGAPAAETSSGSTIPREMASSRDESSTIGYGKSPVRGQEDQAEGKVRKRRVAHVYVCVCGKGGGGGGRLGAGCV